MPYIKVNADNTVTLGGALLHTSDESEGWFLYEDEVFEFSDWNEVENKVVRRAPPIEMLVEKVGIYINEQAKELGYDDINSAISYADTVNITYSLQAKNYKQFRTEVWDYFFELYALAQAGKEIIDPLTFVSTLPTLNTVIAEEDLVREQRNRLLSDSDRIMLADNWAKLTEDQKALWSAYREELRKVPDQEGFPATVTWPTKP